jgi:hypothetical protein
MQKLKNYRGFCIFSRSFKFIMLERYFSIASYVVKSLGMSPVQSESSRAYLINSLIAQFSRLETSKSFIEIAS